ncbi:MAG: glutamine amidotransferase [Frankiales bacterium]|nr:glutamine amidotransferase [Frankiales bacterium]
MSPARLVSTAPRIGVLSLQGDVREHLAALQRVGAVAVPVKTVEALDDLDGLVLPGGESTAIGRLLRVFGLLEPLRARLRAGLPAYGSCAGMVLLADEVVDGLAGQPLLGGLDVTVRRNAFGRQVDSFEAALTVQGIEGDLHAVFIRAPWVERVGEGVEVLAREPGGHPVVIRHGALLATSFHPELTGDDRVHALFVELVRRTMGSAAPGTTAPPNDIPTDTSSTRGDT